MLHPLVALFVSVIYDDVRGLLLNSRMINAIFDDYGMQQEMFMNLLEICTTFNFEDGSLDSKYIDRLNMILSEADKFSR